MPERGTVYPSRAERCPGAMGRTACSWSMYVDADCLLRSSGLGGGRAARSRSLLDHLISRKRSRQQTLGAAATSRTRTRTGDHVLGTLAEVAGLGRRGVSIGCDFEDGAVAKL